MTEIHGGDSVLELGCGYGRVLDRLTAKAGTVVGIDTSAASVALAHRRLGDRPNCHLLVMDALALGLKDRIFDVVVCIQNGVSAFGADQTTLLRESLRVTKPGGAVLLSSYSESFWEDRLAWFELQAQEGLIGAIDPSRTGAGAIVCRDGFRATTVTRAEFSAWASAVGATAKIEEVDESSIFCVLRAL